jgi:hypothetical protein
MVSTGAVDPEKINRCDFLLLRKKEIRSFMAAVSLYNFLVHKQASVNGQKKMSTKKLPVICRHQKFEVSFTGHSRRRMFDRICPCRFLCRWVDNSRLTLAYISAMIPDLSVKSEPIFQKMLSAPSSGSGLSWHSELSQVM